MKKIDPITDLPQISGALTRKPKGITNLEDLKNNNTSFATYGVRKGDIIKFPKTLEDVQVFSQPIRIDSDITQNILVVHRNDRLDYLSFGALHKKDVNNIYSCLFAEQMGQYDNDYDRLIALLGKTITAVDTKVIKAPIYDNNTGVVIEGEAREQNVPIIEYCTGDPFYLDIPNQEFGFVEICGGIGLTNYIIKPGESFVKTDSFSFSFFNHDVSNQIRYIKIEGRYVNTIGPFENEFDVFISVETEAYHYFLSSHEKFRNNLSINEVTNLIYNSVVVLKEDIHSMPRNIVFTEHKPQLYDMDRGGYSFSARLSDSMYYDIYKRHF